MASSVQPGVLLGMGNPLLDISTVVKKDLLEKYELKVRNCTKVVGDSNRLHQDCPKSLHLKFL